MIYVRDKGRLCNNILQFGHAYAWARENGLKAVSMRFSYKYKGFRINSVSGHNMLSYLWAKFAAQLHLIPEVKFDSPGMSDAETAARYRKIARHARTGVVVSGWWIRNYDLFLKYRDEITGLFAFTGGSGDPLPFAHTGTVKLGMHIRRGDYARWNQGKYFYSDAQYIAVINRFIDLMKEQGRGVSVAVFTNDPALDRELFRDGVADGATEVIFPGGTAVDDLHALSLCDYIIGAPSTFSLTAAMYRDVPLYFIEEPDKQFTLNDFSDFETLFRYNY